MLLSKDSVSKDSVTNAECTKFKVKAATVQESNLALKYQRRSDKADIAALKGSVSRRETDAARTT